MVKGLESNRSEDWLRSLGLSCPEDRRLRGGLVVACSSSCWLAAPHAGLQLPAGGPQLPMLACSFLCWPAAPHVELHHPHGTLQPQGCSRAALTFTVWKHNQQLSRLQGMAQYHLCITLSVISLCIFSSSIFPLTALDPLPFSNGSSHSSR